MKGKKKMETFTSSIAFDRRLYKQDIDGSVAHTKMLVKQGIIDEKDGERIVGGLGEIEGEIDSGQFPFREDLEDIHMNIEARLIDKIGAAGGRMHAARSRNDQVAVDMRMWVRDETNEILGLIMTLQRTLVHLSERYKDVVLPGYTHGQQAQPILFAHYLLAHFYALCRDFDRFLDCSSRVNISPLGSCALAGTSLPIDRSYTAKALGFDRPCENALDGVSDRDFVIETIGCCAISQMHLSRLCDDIVTYATEEFGFVALPTPGGSSIMPQKQNPDVAELVRGETGRVYGDLMAILTTMKSLSLSYNKDMQADKRPLFDAIDTLKGSLGAVDGMLLGLGVNEARMRSAISPHTLATDLAERLTVKVPFRVAHGIVREIVSYCREMGKEAGELSLSELEAIAPDIDWAGVDLAIDVDRSVASKRSYGGTSPGEINRSLKMAKTILKEEAGRLPPLD